ncbi:ABC transporter permease [Plantactinospora sp. B24E8]|uniref:ABC transporter permease n=1 Tax=Plantactinospora sp. B24E8 TaxID=3153567 RepID=UPI00325E5EAA
MAHDRAGRPARWFSAFGNWDVLVVVLLALVVVGASVLVEGFATARFWGFLLLDVVPILLIALPMTLVVITGEIDLSVASVLGLASAVLGQLWLTGLPLPLILPLVVLLGALLGAVNGLFIAGFGLPSLAVTIGTLALYRGLAYVVLGDRAVADFPFGWTGGAIRPLPGTTVPWVVLVLAVLAVGFAVLLHATPIGRGLYAMGNNEQAARFSGIAVARTTFWLYVLTGAVAALAGVFWTMRYASARADNGAGLELTVVAAVLLGGVSIFGGRGTLVGVVAGVLLLMTLRSALQLADVPADTLTVVTGTLLILSVVGPNAAAMLRARLRRRRPDAPRATPSRSAPTPVTGAPGA